MNVSANGSLLALALMFSTQVEARGLTPLCPDRGAIQTCTVDKNHLQVETSITDWFDDAESTMLIGDTVVRYGISDSSEIQFGFSPWVRKNDRVGQSDLRMNFRQRIKSDQLSLAIQPMIVVPMGSEDFTQGHLGAGLALAASYDLTPSTQFYVSPTVFAFPDTVVSGAVGVNQAFGPFGGTVELFTQHGVGQHQLALDFTTVWDATEDMEFDINANVGLTRDTPALELIAGVSYRF